MAIESDAAPLTPTTFHILLAISREPLHGYAIMQAVAAAGVKVGPGTVYGALHRMEESGWVTPSRAEKARGATGKRQHYDLTPRGRLILQSEARRIVQTADLVRDQHVLPDDVA